MRCNAYLLIVSLFICLGIPGVIAASPALPCEFYGTIVIDDLAAPAETEINAYIGDRIAGSIITEEDGIYGGTGTFDLRLVVSPFAEELFDGTAVIRFAIGDRFADQTYIFQSGHSTELDLTFGEEFSEDVTLMSLEESSDDATDDSSDDIETSEDSLDDVADDLSDDATDDSSDDIEISEDSLDDVVDDLSDETTDDVTVMDTDSSEA